MERDRAMKRSVYFIIQIVWSFILSTVVWYLTLANSRFDFYGNGDNTAPGVIIFVGAAVYVILTIVQIGVGVKKVKGWRWWVILISLLIAGAMAFLGLYAAVYGSEFLNKMF